MVAFFERGDNGKEVAEDSKEKGRMLSEHETRLVLAVITVGIVLLAIVALVFGGSGSALGRCTGILIQNQRDMCLHALASTTDNVPICGLITSQDERYSCLEGIAEAEGNISLCNELNSTSAYYPDCVLNVSMSTGDESYCQLLNYTDQSSCEFNLSEARKFSSLALCNSIRNKTVGLECTYLHYYGSALKSGSMANCSFLPNVTNYTVMSLMLNSNLTSYANGMRVEYASLNTSPRNFCRLLPVGISRATAPGARRSEACSEMNAIWLSATTTQPSTPRAAWMRVRWR